MNNKFKLPKIDILFQFITSIRYLVFPFILISVNLIKVLPWWGTLASIGGALLLLLVFAYLGWRSFYYVFSDDRIIIYSGLFLKKEKTIYYQRIHSVNISQNIVHRLLKLANLSIETPGVAMGKADAEVRCLSIDKAKYLQEILQYMGEASRNDDVNKKEQLLQTIVSNMENSTSRTIVETQLEGTDTVVAASASSIADANAKLAADRVPGSVLPDHLAKSNELKQKSSVNVTMDTALMFRSALTSLNINIVLVWFAGIFAFADDALNLLFPDSTFIEEYFNKFEFNQSIVIIVIVALVGAILMTWVLSIVFYIIKFFDYKLERKGKQISVSYGLLNREGIVFNETKVQAIVFDENPLRQLMGYGELKVSIVKSTQEVNQVDNSYIVIHPFIRKNEVADYINQLMPKRVIQSHEQMEPLPKASLRTYLFIPTIVGLLPALASAYWLKWSALWLLLIILPIVAWRYIQFKSAAFSIDGTELKMVTRSFSKYSVYLKRQNIISLSERMSPYQYKRGLRKFSLYTLGGLTAKTYTLQGISVDQMGQVKAWLRQYLKR